MAMFSQQYGILKNARPLRNASVTSRRVAHIKLNCHRSEARTTVVPQVEGSVTGGGGGRVVLLRFSGGESPEGHWTQFASLLLKIGSALVTAFFGFPKALDQIEQWLRKVIFLVLKDMKIETGTEGIGTSLAVLQAKTETNEQHWARQLNAVAALPAAVFAMQTDLQHTASTLWKLEEQQSTLQQQQSTLQQQQSTLQQQQSTLQQQQSALQQQQSALAGEVRQEMLQLKEEVRHQQQQNRKQMEKLTKAVVSLALGSKSFVSHWELTSDDM